MECNEIGKQITMVIFTWTMSVKPKQLESIKHFVRGTNSDVETSTCIRKFNQFYFYMW